MKLYEIQQDYAKAVAEYTATLQEAEDAFEAGEIDAEEVNARYETAASLYGEYMAFDQGEFTKKAEATAMAILNMKAEAEIEAAHAKPFEEEALRYRRRQKALERQIDGLKLYAKSQMERMGLTKIEGSALKLAVQNNSAPSTSITDLSSVPAHLLIPQPDKVDTAEAVREWRAGKDVPGVEFVRGTHLRIR